MAQRCTLVAVRNNPNGVAWARANNQPAMVYPPGYHNVNFISAAYAEVDGQFSVMAVAEDSTELNVLLQQSADVQEMTKDALIVISEANQERREVVTDEVKVRRLEIKANAGEELTPEEWAALDPNDATLGIGMSRIFADDLQDLV